MRAFIAIELDKAIKKNLSNLIAELAKKSNQTKIRWIKQEGMHLTLKFLGEIKEDRIAEVENILEKTLKFFKPFPLEVKGTGYFPTEKRNPRVLWVGIEADKNLFLLQEYLEESLEKIGFPREKRKYHPHLTLGRVKSSSSIQDILRELDLHREEVFGKMIVKRITFYQSLLKPSGAEYKIIMGFPL